MDLLLRVAAMDGRWSGFGRGLGLRFRVPQARAAGDHVDDVVPSELCELVLAAHLTAHQQSEDEGALLLEEEDVAWLLVVHVPTDDPECRLVVAGGSLGGPRAAAGTGLFHEAGDVVV